MKFMLLSEVKAKLSRLVDEVQARDEEIVITRNGKGPRPTIYEDAERLARRASPPAD